MLKIIKKWICKYIDKMNGIRVLKYDINKYADYSSTSSFSNQNGRKAARDILVYCHVVEKGLSHKHIKPLFGYDKVKIISDSLVKYVEQGGDDQFIISLAISTLKHYNDTNRKIGVEEDKLIPIPMYEHSDIDVGVDALSADDLFCTEKGYFEKFCKSRHSIRLYDCSSDPVDDKLILKSIEIAQTAPSACNRQSTRVRVIKSKESIQRVLNIQGGASGFGDNSGAVLVISSDISLYAPTERRLPMLDAGLFAMNLLYALHDNNIGACILNGSFTLERERKMQEIVPLPPNEMYCAVIALSAIPKDESVLIAKSCKRPIESIVSFID